MGRARFSIYPWFIIIVIFFRRWADADIHSAKSSSGLWIMQPVMFIHQKLLKH